MSVVYNMQLSVPANKIIRKFAQDNGIIGGAPNSIPVPIWPSTYEKMPDLPDQIIGFYLSSAINDGQMMATGEPVVHPVVQIMARSKTNDSCYALLMQLNNLFIGINSSQIVDITGFDNLAKKFKLWSASPISNIAPLGSERLDNFTQGNQRIPRESIKLDRSLYSMNYRFTITEEDA